MRGPGPPGSSTAFSPTSPTNRIAPTVMKYLSRLGIRLGMEIPVKSCTFKRICARRSSLARRSALIFLCRASRPYGSLDGDGPAQCGLTFPRWAGERLNHRRKLAPIAGIRGKLVLFPRYDEAAY